MFRTAAIMIAMALGGPVSAHSALISSTPVDGAELEVSPDQISMEFNQRIRLTKVSLIGDGGEIEVDVSGSADFLTTVEMAVAELRPGTYRVEWRGLSVDGHIQSGDFGFSIG